WPCDLIRRTLGVRFLMRGFSMRTRNRKLAVIPPAVLSLTLLFSACGGGSHDAVPSAQQQSAAVDAGVAPVGDAPVSAPAAAVDPAVSAAVGAAPVDAVAPVAKGKPAVAPVATGADKAKLPKSEAGTTK